MSTLAGIVYKKEVWLAADSLASTECGDIHPAMLKKIFRNEDYLIGFVGSIRGGQILYPQYFTPPKDIFDFPDALREQSIEKGCAGSDENQMMICGSNYLIAYKNKLYRIMADFSISQIQEYAAVGSGADYAHGSLKTSASFKLPPVPRLTVALEAAKEFNTATGGEIQIEKY
jgi:ATP-dependent protease HslVU (ClpYQ) peptidase subunit